MKMRESSLVSRFQGWLQIERPAVVRFLNRPAPILSHPLHLIGVYMNKLPRASITTLCEICGFRHGVGAQTSGTAIPKLANDLATLSSMRNSSGQLNSLGLMPARDLLCHH